MADTSFDLTGPNVACAVGITKYEESAKLLIVGNNDLEAYHRNEEAFLRRIGIVAEGQKFNGLIVENEPQAAPPSSIPAKICIYQHITSGGCSCTYKKKCFDVLIPVGPGMPAGPLPPNPIDELVSTCGGGASTLALEIDHSVEVLLSSRALNTLLLAPNKLCDIIDLDGLPTNGVLTPVFDPDLIDQTSWHLSTWAHIVSGSCKCKYLPVEARAVDVSGKFARRDKKPGKNPCAPKRPEGYKSKK